MMSNVTGSKVVLGSRLGFVVVLATQLLVPSLSLAGPSYVYNGSAPPGDSGGLGNTMYLGPNDFQGIVSSNFPFGIEGFGTPINSGKTILYDEANFGVNVNATFPIPGSIGSLSIVNPGQGIGFSGNVISSNVGMNGGTFQVVGFFGADVANFFGVSQNAELSGTVTIEFDGPSRPSSNNAIASIQFAFAPDGSFAVPEPASVVLVGIGGVTFLACWVAKRRAVRNSRLKFV